MVECMVIGLKSLCRLAFMGTKILFFCNLCQVRTSEWIACSVQGPHFVIFIALPSCCDHIANSILCESSPQITEQ